jgi:hypothetical protein
MLRWKRSSHPRPPTPPSPPQGARPSRCAPAARLAVNVCGAQAPASKPPPVNDGLLRPSKLLFVHLHMCKAPINLGWNIVSIVRTCCSSWAGPDPVNCRCSTTLLCSPQCRPVCLGRIPTALPLASTRAHSRLCCSPKQWTLKSLSGCWDARRPSAALSSPNCYIQAHTADSPIRLARAGGACPGRAAALCEVRPGPLHRHPAARTQRQRGRTGFDRCGPAAASRGLSLRLLRPL